MYASPLELSVQYRGREPRVTVTFPDFNPSNFRLTTLNFKSRDPKYVEGEIRFISPEEIKQREEQDPGIWPPITITVTDVDRIYAAIAFYDTNASASDGFYLPNEGLTERARERVDRHWKVIEPVDHNEAFDFSLALAKALREHQVFPTPLKNMLNKISKIQALDSI